MKTEHRLAEALKEMMSQMSLDEISVTALVKKCHVNRQTFYYHFHDIYDLLTLVFLDEKIPNIEQAKSIKQMLSYMYDYYRSNKSFIDATINSACHDLFEEFIYNATYKTILRIIGDQKDSKKLTPNDRKLIARFYSQAYSRTAVYYLSTYKNTSFEGLCHSFAFEDEDVFAHAVNNMVIFRGKDKDND